MFKHLIKYYVGTFCSSLGSWPNDVHTHIPVLDSECYIQEPTPGWLLHWWFSRQSCIQPEGSISRQSQNKIKKEKKLTCSRGHFDDSARSEVPLYLDKKWCLLQMVLWDAILEICLWKLVPIVIIFRLQRMSRQNSSSYNSLCIIWNEKEHYMHQQCVVYVDPESNLFIICHSSQINGLQPIQN